MCTAPCFTLLHTHRNTDNTCLPVLNVIRSGWFYLSVSLSTGVGGESLAEGWAQREGRSFWPEQSLVKGGGGLHFFKTKQKSILNTFGSILGSYLANVFNSGHVFSLNGTFSTFHGCVHVWIFFFCVLSHR